MKNRRICKLTAVMLMMAMVVSMFVFPSIPAKCATAGLTKLEADKVYTALDITGDSKKDRFKIKRSESVGTDKPEYRSFSVSINGKKAFDYTCIYKKVYTHLTPVLISLENGKKFLFISLRNSDTHRSVMTGVFQYKGGKLVQVIDFDEYCKRHCYTWKVVPKSVNGNKVNFTVTMESNEKKGYYTGNIVMQFVYKNGTLKQNDSAAHVDKNTEKFIIGKNTWTYTTPERTQNCYKLLAGDIVIADECRITTKKIQLRVRRGNIKAWMLLSNGVIDRTLYKKDLDK